MSHAKAVTSFVTIDAPGQPIDAARNSILEDYYTSGFALFQIQLAGQSPSEALHNLTAALNLGEAFVPPLYQFSHSTLYDDLGMSSLVAAQGVAPPSHPVFGSTDALELHTDGTLQEIGEIPTSVLFCVTPAWEGGHTTLFQSVNAFSALQRSDPALASALLDSRALTRQASVNGSREKCTGPVFTYKEGALVTRYSVTDRDRWNVDEVGRLTDAKSAMGGLAQLNTPYYHQVSLGTGQGVILANNRVSHGRTGFSNSPNQIRQMLRVLFARQPH